jgi:hypothetical protein
LSDRDPHRLAQLRVIEFAICDMATEIDRAEITNGRLGARRHFDDLGAKIREMDDGPVDGRLITFRIARVLEGHPAVASLRERPHHARIKIAGFDLFQRQAIRLGLFISGIECRAI